MATTTSSLISSSIPDDIERPHTVATTHEFGSSNDDENANNNTNKTNNIIAALSFMDTTPTTTVTVTSSTPSNHNHDEVPVEDNLLEHNKQQHQRQQEQQQVVELEDSCNLTTSSSPVPPLQDDTSDSSMDHNPTYHHRNTSRKVEDDDDDDGRDDDYDLEGTDTSVSRQKQEQQQQQHLPINPERTDTDGAYYRSLEERVQALEERLATLSLLLQRRHSSHRQPSPNSPQYGTLRRTLGLPITPPESPPPEDVMEYNSSVGGSGPGGRTPALDSPAFFERPTVDMSTGKHVRNLSFRVFHTDEFADVAAAAAAAVAAAASTATTVTVDDGYKHPSINLGEQFERVIHGDGGGKDVVSTNDDIFLPNTFPKDSDYKSKQIPNCTLRKVTKPDFGNGDGFSAISNDINNNNNSSLDAVNNNDGKNSIGLRPLTVSSPGLLGQSLQPIASTDSSSSPEKSESLTPSPVKIGRTTPSIDNSNHNQNTNGSSSSSIKSKWLDYLNSVQESSYDTDKHMEEFVKVPSAVEALLSFGFWICVDSFLYTLTILPIRFVWSCLLLVRFLAIRIWKLRVPADGPFRFHRRHSYQLIQVSIVYTIYKFVLMPVDISIIYHWIRVQSMVKLYLLIAIVEVFDRLMCSLGQDCLDSLYMRTTSMPRSSRMIISVIVVLVYTALHSFLLFVHVATLNVAMNSDDQALLSLLIGGNFAEIKSTVFKKYNKASLFKITASDICERFKLALFLLLVLALNMSHGMDKKMVYSYFHMCGIVWCAEWLSDWIKHAFITKFNYIASGVYSEYGLLLAGDVTGIGHENLNLDHSHAVVKRLGLAQLPLVCVMAKYLKEVYKYAMYDRRPPTWMVGVGFFTIWSLLLVCKLSLGSFLHQISRKRLEVAPEFSKSNTTVQKKKNN